MDKTTVEADVSELTEISEEQAPTRLPEDFKVFYNRFHTDTSYQLSRVVFPIKTIVQEGDSVLTVTEKLITRDKWTIHKPYDSKGGTFERTFQIQDGIINERITAQEGLFSVEKRYTKLADEWHLIYYQGLIMHG